MLNDRQIFQIEDIFEFARLNQQRQFQLRLSDIGQRIVAHDTLVNVDKTCINCIVSGYIGEFAYHYIRIILSGSLHLICQRCLKPMEYQLNDTSDIAIFQTEQALEKAENTEQSIIEGIALDQSDNIMEWIEDQLIMAIPLASYHESCDDIDGQQYKEKNNPFKVLSSLNLKK